MKKSYIMVRGVLRPGEAPKLLPVRDHGRKITNDVAFNLRMGAGSPGDVTRPNPTIEACQLATVTPPTSFGQCVVASGQADNGVRLVQAGDGALTDIYGVTVRPYPYQQATATNYGATGFGVGALATSQPVDVLRRGYILGYINGTPKKGDPVNVWIAASAGAHVQGSFEAAATGGSTIALPVTACSFQGGVDASGFGEIAIHI